MDLNPTSVSNHFALPGFASLILIKYFAARTRPDGNRMHLLTSFLTTLLITGTLAAPSTGPRAADTIGVTLARAAQGVEPGNGTSGGFYYYFWSDREGPVTYNNLEGGRYTVQWGGDGRTSGNFFAGKGWNFESADNLKLAWPFLLITILSPTRN